MSHKKVTKLLLRPLSVVVLMCVFSRSQEPVLPSPTNVSATTIDSTSIDVTWTPVADSRVVGYTVKCGIDGQIDNSCTQEVDGIDTSQTILTGLKPHTEYLIFVHSRTSSGELSFSPGSTIVTTDEDVPSSPPQDFNAESKSTSTILVSWLEVLEDDKNGDILGYRVSYRKQEESDYNTLDVEGEENLQEIITGLQADTAYVFAVLAYTSVGDGPLSDDVLERTWALPTTTTIPTTTTETNLISTSLSTTIQASFSTQQTGVEETEPDPGSNTTITTEIAITVGCAFAVVTATVAAIIVYRCLIKNKKNLVSPSV
ncbi:receptor-type tyrosine-protein phosphatase F-like [Glandiceps talaboti]